MRDGLEHAGSSGQRTDRVTAEYMRELNSVLDKGDDKTIRDRLRRLDERYLELMYLKRFGSADPRVHQFRSTSDSARGKITHARPDEKELTPKTDWEKYSDSLANKYGFLVDGRSVANPMDSWRELNLTNLP
eukprot:GEMP01138860.1.p1 GENE.GEMP01138860.1~~GEMP01138860.1.p1  ORF type:complete len:141 (+),score=22.95 GEMP01138860.1:29-424(+)